MWHRWVHPMLCQAVYAATKATPHVVAALSDQPARGLVVAAPSAFARLNRSSGNAE